MSVAEAVFGRIADGELVIIDGGTGTQLQAEGVPMDELAWSARANLEQPDVVQHVHEEYIRAGAEVIIANTYASSRAALEPAGLGSRVAEANRSAVRAALWAREAAATGPVAVAGSMSSFSPHDMEAGGLGRPLAGPADEDPRFATLAHFREQAELLAEEGVDLIALEMINARGYGRAALQAAAETGLPVWLGISAFHREDGTLSTLLELGDGDSVADLLSALAGPELAAERPGRPGAGRDHRDALQARGEPGRDRDHPRPLRRAHRGLRRDRRLAAAELGIRRPAARRVPPAGDHLGRRRGAAHRRLLRCRARAHTSARRRPAPSQHAASARTLSAKIMTDPQLAHSAGRAAAGSEGAKLDKNVARMTLWGSEMRFG